MKIIATVTVEVSETDWANEYGLEPKEVVADVESYLTTMLQECSPLIKLDSLKADRDRAASGRVRMPVEVVTWKKP